MQERRVIDAEGRIGSAQVDQTGDIVEKPPPRDGEPLEIDRIHLFVGMPDDQVVLVGELVTGKDHGNAHGGEQADKAEPEALFFFIHLIVFQKVVKAFVAEAFHIMGPQVIDHLMSMFIAGFPAIDDLLQRIRESVVPGTGLTRCSWHTPTAGRRSCQQAD